MDAAADHIFFQPLRILPWESRERLYTPARTQQRHGMENAKGFSFKSRLLSVPEAGSSLPGPSAQD